MKRFQKIESVTKDPYDFSEFERSKKWKEQEQVIMAAFAGVTVFVIALVAALVWLNKWNIRRHSKQPPSSRDAPALMRTGSSVQRSVNIQAPEVEVNKSQRSAETNETIMKEQIIGTKSAEDLQQSKSD